MEHYTDLQKQHKLDEIIATTKVLGCNAETWSEDGSLERTYLQFSDAENGARVQISPDDDIITAVHKLLQILYSRSEDMRIGELLDHELVAANERCQKIGCRCSRDGHLIVYHRSCRVYKLSNFAFSDWRHHGNRFFFETDELRKLTEAICHDEEIYRTHSSQT